MKNSIPNRKFCLKYQHTIFHGNNPVFWKISVFAHWVSLCYNNKMISRSKVQKAVHACMIRLLNLEPAEHEEAAIYVVNQRIPNVRELRELLCSGAICGYQVRCKRSFGPNIILIRKRYLRKAIQDKDSKEKEIHHVL